MTVIAVAGGACLLVIASSSLLGRKVIKLVRGWKSKDPEEMERLRRLDINRRGRIVSAEIVDFIENLTSQAPGRVVVYRYQVAGVVYEAAQEVSSFAGLDLVTEGLAGTASSVKYDPQQPVNSIIACEEWSGFKAGK